MKKYNFHDDFEVLNKMDLKSDNADFLRLLNRILSRQCRAVKTPENLFDKNYEIKGYKEQSLKIKVIGPKNQPAKLPALLFLHGGGFVVDVSDTHLKHCYQYAAAVNCVVVLPYYHLLPKHPFPAAFDDCYEALKWMVNEADMLGIDKNNIGIFGESCGGCLAAGITQKSRDENGPALQFQCLIYPVTDHSCSFSSIEIFEDAPVWKKKHNLIMWEQYLNGHEVLPKYAVPYSANSFENLPPAYVEVCEVDCLRDEGLAYAKKLKQAGISVEINDIQQACHGFDAVENSEITQKALENRIRVMKQFFKTI